MSNNINVNTSQKEDTTIARKSTTQEQQKRGKAKKQTHVKANTQATDDKGKTNHQPQQAKMLNKKPTNNNINTSITTDKNKKLQHMDNNIITQKQKTTTKQQNTCIY